ncbi:hypothetical protein [Lacticaseibacillus paracasei]|uniref:hypothetical protein n=1 Tax=Lacticaseibacillus paracasei TaxID=1597 RepID=UPI0031F6E4C6
MTEDYNDEIDFLEDEIKSKSFVRHSIYELKQKAIELGLNPKKIQHLLDILFDSQIITFSPQLGIGEDARPLHFGPASKTINKLETIRKG